MILHLDEPCIDVTDKAEIPSIESSCLLLAADSTWIRIEQDNYGTIIQLCELAVAPYREGLLRVQRKPVERSVISSLKNLEIYTAPRQQCVVGLEDGIKIRMNAQSRLSYPRLKRHSTVVYMKGEAYVDANKRYGILVMKKAK